MSSHTLWKTIFITGPTSSGKTDLAIYLAKKFNGEIINADSRQVYKYLDIGSGKTEHTDTTRNLQNKQKNYFPYCLLIPCPFPNCPFHLFSIAHPKRNYSLGKWLKDAEKAVRKILKKNKLPIFCGGTILYLKAIKEGWVLPEVKPNHQLRKELEKKTNEELYQQIKKIDPQRAKGLDPQNKRRLIRALEIIYSLGKVPKIKKKPKYNLLILAPYVEKEKLFKKIRKRLIQRVPGIIEEIKKLRKLGLSFERIISFGLEYKWFGLYVKKIQNVKSTLHYREFRVAPNPMWFGAKIENNNFGFFKGFRVNPRNNNPLLSACIELCYQDIIRFAKRQIRELRKIEDIVWVKNKKEAVKIVENFLKN